MPVPGVVFLLSEPPAHFRADGGQLIILVFAVVLPPCYFPFEIDRPAVIEAVFRLQRWHEQGIVEQIGLDHQVLGECFPQFPGSLRRGYRGGLRRSVRSRSGRYQRRCVAKPGCLCLFLFRKSGIRGSSTGSNLVYRRGGFSVADGRKTGTHFRENVFHHIIIGLSATQVHQLFLASVHDFAMGVANPHGSIVEDV